MWEIYKMDRNKKWVSMGLWDHDPRPFFIENEELDERYMFVDRTPR